MYPGADGARMVQTDFRYRPPVCPYISSTFDDFQVERSVLVQRVFPAVDALCRLRGAYCAPVDLRWTVKDAQTSPCGVIRLSLDYVTQCCPFFVSLLGERYGPHRPKQAGPLPRCAEHLPPEADWLDQNLLVAASSGYDWLFQDTYQHYSVSELEIVQATQLADAEHAYFYFRQPDHVDLLFTDLPEIARRKLLSVYEAESDYSHHKVRDLKARIVKRGFPIRYFKTPDELAELALDDWMALVDRLYPPLERSPCRAVTPLANDERFAEWVAHETFAETRRRAFVRSTEMDITMAEMTTFTARCLHTPPTEDYRVEQETFKQNHRCSQVEEGELVEAGVLVLLGDRGSGKTALVSNWAQEFAADHPDIHVISHYVGASARSADVSALLRHCVQDIRGEQLTGVGADDPGQVAAGIYPLAEVFGAALSIRPCVLIIDGIDEMSGTSGITPQQLKELWWLPLPLPPQCRLVVSTVRSDVTYHVLKRRPDVRIMAVPPLTDLETRTEILEEHINAQCLFVNSSHIDRVVSCKLAARPLFLSVLGHELRILGVSPNLEKHLDGYLDSSSIRDLWSRVLQRWVSDYSWTVYNPLAADDEAQHKGKGYSGWVADALRLIAVSKNGLTQQEILAILTTLGYHGQREVTSFDWAQFRYAAQGALFERPGGLLSFCHQHLKEAVEYTLLGGMTSDLVAARDNKAKNSQPSNGVMNPSVGSHHIEPTSADPTQKAFHQHLAQYFAVCPHGPRRTEVLPWQLEMCNNMSQLRDVLSEPRLFLELHGDPDRGQSGRFDLFHFWQVLKHAGHDPSIAYKEVINRASTTAPHLPKIGINDEEKPEEKGMEESEPFQQSASSIGTVSDIYAPLVGENLSENLSGHQKARLYHVTASFLAKLGYLDDAEGLLTMAHNKLYESYPLSYSAQHLLCGVEEALADLSVQRADRGGAWKWYQKALRSTESLLEGIKDENIIRRHTQSKGRLLDHLGHLKTNARHYKEAETLLKRADQCLAQSQSDRDKATVQHHLGTLRLCFGEFVRAEMMFRQAISTREQLFGKSHPIVAEVLHDLAGLLCHPKNQISCERYEAEALYRRAIRIRERCLGEDHLHVATTLFQLGKLLKADGSSGHRPECILLLRRALDIRTTKLGVDHANTKSVRWVLSGLKNGVHQSPQTEMGTSLTTTSGAGRHSKMTWHDAELLTFQQRERTKMAEAARHKPAQQKMGSPGYRESETKRSSSSKQKRGGSTYSPVDPRDTSVDEIVFSAAVKRPSAGDLLRASGKSEESSARQDDGEATATSGAGNNSGGKVHPDSSYGKRKMLAYVKFTEHHPALCPARPSVLKVASPPSLHSDSHTSSPVPTRRLKPGKPVRAKLVLRITRPLAEPNKLSKRDATSTGSTAPSSTDSSEQCSDPRVAPAPSHTTITLLPENRNSPCAAGSSLLSGSAPLGVYHLHVHKQHCCIPGPHTNDIHNAYSCTKGPNSSVLSLLGAPAAPRDVFLRVQHASAWYHVPGRYGTADQPYPPKRCQRRPGSEAISPNSRLWDSADDVLWKGGRATTTDENISRHSWDSGNGVPLVGAVSRGMVDSWVT